MNTPDSKRTAAQTNFTLNLDLYEMTAALAACATLKATLHSDTDVLVQSIVGGAYGYLDKFEKKLIRIHNDVTGENLTKNPLRMD